MVTMLSKNYVSHSTECSYYEIQHHCNNYIAVLQFFKKI